MSQMEIIKQVYELQTNLAERNARIETNIDYMMGRMDKQDTILEKLSDAVNEQKTISASVETLTRQVSDQGAQILQQEMEINNLHKKNDCVKEKFEELEDKIDGIENKPAKNALAVWKKIGGIILTVTVTAFITLLLTYLSKGKL